MSTATIEPTPDLAKEFGRLARSINAWGSVTQLMILVALGGVVWLIVGGQQQAASTQQDILKASDRIVACVETPAHCPGYQPLRVTTTVTATVPGPPQPVTVTVTQPPQIVTVPVPTRIVPSPVVTTVAPSPAASVVVPVPIPTCLLGICLPPLTGHAAPATACHGKGAKAC